MADEGSTAMAAAPPGFSSPPNMDSASIPQLMKFLQSSFLKADFEKVETTLISREASLRAAIERSFSEELTLKEVDKMEVEARVEGLQRDLGVWRSTCADLEQRIKTLEEEFGVERAELERKLREEKARYSLLEAKFRDCDEEIRKYKRSCESLEEEMARLKEACKVTSKGAQEKFATLLHLQEEHSDIDSWRRKHQELVARISQRKEGNQVLRGTERNRKEEKGKDKTWVLLDVEVGSDGKENLPTTDKGNPVVGGVIEISDSEDELQEHVLEGASDVKNESTCEKSTKMMDSDNSRNLLLQQDDNIHMEGVLPIPTPKRRRISRVVTSDSENEYDNDHIPISKLRSQRVNDVVEENKELSIVMEDMAPSRKRLVLLRELYNSGCALKGRSPGNPSTPCAKRITSRNKERAHRKLDYSDSEDDEEDGINERKEADDAGSDSEGESLGGFIVSESDSPAYEPDSPASEPCLESSCSGSSSSSKEVDSDLDLANVLADIRRKKASKTWEYEADMLASFSRDPELCMKAVCALYRQQTSDEQSVKETLLFNRRGFSKIDAQRGSMLAEFLTNGDPYGPLKKSVKDLENYDPKALDYCHKLASRYSKQLFTIYQNKEDPFFHPT